MQLTQRHRKNNAINPKNCTHNDQLSKQSKAETAKSKYAAQYQQLFATGFGGY